MGHLSVEDAVDERIEDDGSFGEERWNGGDAGCYVGSSALFGECFHQRNDRVRRPGHHERRYHEAHHRVDSLLGFLVG